MFEIDRLTNESLKAGKYGVIPYEEFQKVRASIFHYTIADLEEILKEIEAIHDLIRRFIGFALAVVSRQDEAASESYLQLIDEPLVRQFLSTPSSSPKS